MQKFLAKLFIFTIIFNFFNPIFTIGQVFAGNLTVDFETTSGYTVTEGTWDRTSADKHEGTYSIVANNGGADNSNSCFEITRDSTYDSNISFYYKVSSESNYDYLRFYLDGTEQDKWSGDVAWSEYTKAINSGNHTFKWCYTKDGSVSNGDDTAWVDIFTSEDVIIETTAILDFETTGGYTVSEGTWNRTTADKYEGSYSLVADNGGNDNTSSCFTRDENFSDTGSISFYYKVSSESNYDFLRFYIDGTEEDTWSGDVAWTEYSKEIAGGDYTFKWCYTKDGSQSNGSDTAWVDYVTKKITKESIFLDEITPVFNPTNDNTPSYTFSTPITGDITYTGSCDSSTDSVSSTGNLTIDFNSLADGTYNDCKIKVSNATDSSEWLPVSEFQIDTIVPIITEDIPNNEEVKSGTFQIKIAHSDTGGLNLASLDFKVYKWLGGTNWNDVSGDVLSNTSTTSTGTISDFSGNDGKYKIVYSISDNATNNSNKDIIFYVDTDTIVDFENTSGYTANSADWDRQTTKVYEGTYALESQNRDDNTTACFTINETIPGTGTVDFYYSVSSESGYDFLRFSIDGTEQDSWAGEIDWTHSTSYEFNDGDHELKWCYEKDGSVSNGDDRAWVDYIVMQRSDKPTISEVTAVSTPTTDNTPDYTFNTSIDGNIAYSGSCDVAGNSDTATTGDNTITFGTLVDGEYNDCEIQVTSSTDSTPWLSVTDFTVDANGPIYSSVFPDLNQIIPKNNFDIKLNYSDSPSGVDNTTSNFKLYKWDSDNSIWNDITSNISSSTVTTYQATYTTSDLDFGKYKYDFSIKDSAGNQSNKNIEFYIDQPELIISTGTINIGELNDSTNKFGDTITVTVKTIGTAFKVKLNKNENLELDSGEIISYYDGTIGLGYDKNDDGDLSDYNDDIIMEEIKNINTDGELNTYTYTLKIGAIIDKLQAAGNYEGKIDFEIELDY